MTTRESSLWSHTERIPNKVGQDISGGVKKKIIFFHKQELKKFVKISQHKLQTLDFLLNYKYLEERNEMKILSVKSDSINSTEMKDVQFNKGNASPFSTVSYSLPLYDSLLESQLRCKQGFCLCFCLICSLNMVQCLNIRNDQYSLD